MAVKKHTKKKQKIRHNEYYGTQSVFDDLYCESKNGKKFRNLMGLITSEQNVLLAYRNIKKNKGSNTPGTKPVLPFLRTCALSGF